MHIAFLNPQGNFDPEDLYWAAHPDFGGQLVYVKEVALALGRMGHQVDILTQRIVDSEWSGFEAVLDGYPDAPNVRIIRLQLGGDAFLRKENLWPYLGTDWVPNIIEFYADEEYQPDVATSHYGDGGLAAALWQEKGGPPFTFTGHSLGAQKLERLLLDEHHHHTLAELDNHYHFARRLVAERVAMNHAARIITSTYQERDEQYSHQAYQGAVDVADKAKFTIIPPGVNLKIFCTHVSGAEDERVAEYIEQMLTRDIAPERRGLPTVLCSSRLEPKKNHLGLMLAFARNTELQESANLLIVVRGAENIYSRQEFTEEEKLVLDELVAILESHKLIGKVTAFSLESQEELASAYRYLSTRHSVFALTAQYEPFGLAPLEAMACGLPAVVTCNGGPSESLFDDEEDKEYGVLVDPSDPGDVAKGLLRLVGKDNEWTYFHRAGRQRVLDKYTWEHTAKGYLAVLEEILAAGEVRGSVQELPLPAYFTYPVPENDVGLEELQRLYSGVRAK